MTTLGGETRGRGGQRRRGLLRAALHGRVVSHADRLAGQRPGQPAGRRPADRRRPGESGRSGAGRPAAPAAWSWTPTARCCWPASPAMSWPSCPPIPSSRCWRRPSGRCRWPPAASCRRGTISGNWWRPMPSNWPRISAPPAAAASKAPSSSPRPCAAAATTSTWPPSADGPSDGRAGCHRGADLLSTKAAEIHPFTRIEGPCYVGKQSILLGAKCRQGNTIGPMCRVGGEVEHSILQGYTNKYHDGFLGHAYVGQWVNLGAGTTNSDLRNDYGRVKVVLDGRTAIDTGSNKMGALIGDHTKTCHRHAAEHRRLRGGHGPTGHARRAAAEVHSLVRLGAQGGDRAKGRAKRRLYDTARRRWPAAAPPGPRPTRRCGTRCIR